MTAIGSRLSVIGYRLSVIGYRLSSCFEWSSLVGWRSVMSYELWVFEVLGILDRHRSALAGMSYELWVIEFFLHSRPSSVGARLWVATRRDSGEVVGEWLCDDGRHLSVSGVFWTPTRERCLRVAVITYHVSVWPEN